MNQESLAGSGQPTMSGRGGRGSAWQQPPPPPPSSSSPTHPPLPLHHPQPSPPTRLPPPQQQQQQQDARWRTIHSTTSGGAGRGGSLPVHTQSGIPFGHVPAYLPGSASLVEELDRRLLIVLRDGKHIVGTMISYDQFSNLILQDAVERRMVVSDGICHYHDIPLGVYIVRGDSIVLMGQVDSVREQHTMKEVDLTELDNLEEAAKTTGATAWDVDSDLIA